MRSEYSVCKSLVVVVPVHGRAIKRLCLGWKFRTLVRRTNAVKMSQLAGLTCFSLWNFAARLFGPVSWMLLGKVVSQITRKSSNPAMRKEKERKKTFLSIQAETRASKKYGTNFAHSMKQWVDDFILHIGVHLQRRRVVIFKKIFLPDSQNVALSRWKIRQHFSRCHAAERGRKIYGMQKFWIFSLRLRSALL